MSAKKPGWRGPPEIARAPGRGYRWRTAWPNNDLAVKHGIHASAEKLDQDPRAAEIEADLLTRYPWLRDPAFESARVALRRVEQRIARAVEWLEEHGEIDPDTGKVADVAHHLSRLERLARDLRNDVGGAPVAAAKLVAIARDQVDVGGELARARELRLRREAEIAEVSAAPESDPDPEAAP
jgi:hypothetical protein